jgi:lysophospholipase L1-like esterase
MRWWSKRSRRQKIGLVSASALLSTGTAFAAPAVVDQGQDRGWHHFTTRWAPSADFQPNTDDPEIVALGDSFLGTNGGPNNPNDKACKQTINDLGADVLRDEGMPEPEVQREVDRLYCSTKDTSWAMRQVRRIPRNSKNILIRVGGNDGNKNADAYIDVAEVLQDCIESTSRCVTPTVKKHWASGLQLFEKQLTSLVKSVRKRAPDATVILAAYPDVFKDPQGPPITSDSLFLYATDMNDFSQLLVELNMVFARVAKATGVAFFDPNERARVMLAGHHLEDRSGATYFQPLTAQYLYEKMYDIANGELPPIFHPNRQGYEAEAGAMYRFIASGEARGEMHFGIALTSG